MRRWLLADMVRSLADEKFVMPTYTVCARQVFCFSCPMPQNTAATRPKPSRRCLNQRMCPPDDVTATTCCTHEIRCGSSSDASLDGRARRQ